MAPRMFNLCTRWRRAVIFTFRPCCSEGDVPMNKRLSRLQGRSWYVSYPAASRSTILLVFILTKLSRLLIVAESKFSDGRILAPVHASVVSLLRANRSVRSHGASCSYRTDSSAFTFRNFQRGCGWGGIMEKFLTQACKKNCKFWRLWF